MKGGVCRMAELKNIRHEKFAQGIASGLSQRKAYLAAFPKSANWKDATVDKRASELSKKGEILGRVKELAEQSSKKTIMNAIQRKEWLTEVIKSDKEETKDKLKAIDILNRMQGDYVTKIEADVDTTVNINIELSDD
jgi:hypothetical protein